MKTKMFKSLLLASAIMIVLLTGGCNKEEEDKPSNTELLTREWNIVSVDGTTVLEGLGVDAATLNFATNGDLEMSVTYEGSTISVTVEWQWINGETAIKINDGTDTYDWTLEKLTADDFWFTDTSDGTYYKCEAM